MPTATTPPERARIRRSSSCTAARACSIAAQTRSTREFDAYAALGYLLQGSPDIRADRIGGVGWSQGGGALLNTIRDSNPVRPATLPRGDFRAAVAFYPASCRRSAQGAQWSSPTPLLLLLGGKDVWIPLQPCEELMS